KKQYEQAEMTNAQLEKEKSDLFFKVNKLRETVEGLCSLLSETHKKYDEAMK
ncbi:early endosome antigen 1-like isoform X2, partial [Clarias magur]